MMRPFSFNAAHEIKILLDPAAHHDQQAEIACDPDARAACEKVAAGCREKAAEYERKPPAGFSARRKVCA